MANTLGVVSFIVYLLEGIFIIFANIISLVIFVKKFRHLKTYMLLINLSFADLMVGFYTVLMSINYLMVATSLWSLYPQNQKCIGAFRIFNIVFSDIVILESLATLVVIALERAFAIIKPIRHRVIKTKYYRLGIFFTWCISTVPGICFMVMRCNPKVGHFTAFLLRNGLGMIYLSIMIIAYVAIYVKMRFYPVFQHNASTQMQVRLCKTLFLATIASAIAYLPFCISSIYRYMHVTSPSLYVNIITEFLVCSNSFVNCLIYAWKMPAFRNELINMFMSVLRKPNNTVHNAGVTPLRRNRMMTGCNNINTNGVLVEPTPVKDLVNQAPPSS